MKYTLTLMLLASMAVCSAQKIKTSEKDKFDNTRRIETSYVDVNMTLTTRMDIKVWSVNDRIYIYVRGGSGVVGKGDKFIFLLANNKTITAYSTGVQSALIDGGYIYSLALYDVIELSKEIVTDFRYETTDGFIDNSMKSAAQTKLKKLFQVYLEEYEKYFHVEK